MLSKFPNWGSGVTFPVSPISCFTDEYYCCSGLLLNARFLAKKWDPGENIRLLLHVSMLQVALKMVFQLWSHFFNWPFQAWMRCTAILAAGPILWISAVWTPQNPSSPTTRESLVSPGSRFVQWSSPLLGGKIIYSPFPYTHFSVIYQLSFIINWLSNLPVELITFLIDSVVWLPLKVTGEAVMLFPFLLGSCKEEKIPCCGF